MKDISYLWLIPFFPALGCFINATFGRTLHRKFGEKASALIGVSMPWISFIVAATAVWNLIQAHSGTILINKVWTWMAVGHLHADFAFSIDALSAMMVLIVTFVGSLIHIYAVGYMKGDPGFWRFLCYLNGFMFAMLLLILGDNMLLMFVGWEGVGLCSYLLIGFWYHEVANAKAGMKAFVVNRVGDFGFLIGFFILFWGLGGNWGEHGYHIQNAFTITFRELPHLVEAAADKTLWGVPVLTLVALFFFIGATGKSAQIPLYVWLPDAMAGPTPVSALIHAATMVTAGVYMIARFNFIYIHSPLAMTVIAVVGASTALFAATIGCTQQDIKKVLAYSTVSQLGFMFIGVGVGAYWAGAYHLLTHAFFKACLFLGAGSVILSMHHEQDMRKMGGLKEYMPITRWTYWIACVAITGFPIASGFYSKDEILWQAFNSASLLIPGWVIWAMGFTAAGLTSFYMWRSYFLTFTGPSPKPAHHDHGDAHDTHSSHDTHTSHDAHGHGDHKPKEQPLVITGVLSVLALLAVAASVIGIPALWTHKEPILERFLAPVFIHAEHLPKVFAHGTGHNVEWLLMILSTTMATGGLALAWWMYRGRSNPFPAKLAAAFPNLHRVIYNKYYVDEMYDATVVKSFMGISYGSSWFDKNIIDFLVNFVGYITRTIAWIDGMIDKHMVDATVNFIAQFTHSISGAVRRMQTGSINAYFTSLSVGFLVLVLIAKLLMDVYR